MTRRRIPDELVDRAIELIRGGTLLPDAAKAVDLERSTLAMRLRRRGLSVADLRPPLSSHRGVQYGPRARRYPCRYCGAPVTKPNVACPAGECQRRRQQEYLAAHPEATATRKARLLAWSDDERRQQGATRFAENSGHGRRRETLAVNLKPTEKQALADYAERHGLSMSAVVVRTLQQAGVI